jgi:hypothetical protein
MTRRLTERERTLTLTGKCIACGKRFTIDLQQAERDECAISPCCNFPSTVEQASSRVKRVKGGDAKCPSEKA